LATWSQGWRGLTQSQRNGWITGAGSFPIIDIFGDSKILAGNALYTQLNVNLALVSAASIDDLPSPDSIPPITSLTLTAAEGTPAVSLAFAPSPVPAGYNYLIEATPPMAPSRLFVKNMFRVVSHVAAAGTTPFNALTAYAAIFGNPVATKVIYIRVTVISLTTGQRGVPFQTSAIVAA
jgi:hypothetical protein